MTWLECEGENKKILISHDLKSPWESFLLFVSGLLCEEFAHDPTVISSLLQLKHAASNTPIGLWGTDDGIEALPMFVDPLLSAKSWISWRHFCTLPCKFHKWKQNPFQKINQSFVAARPKQRSFSGDKKFNITEKLISRRIEGEMEGKLHFSKVQAWQVNFLGAFFQSSSSARLPT